MKKKNVFFFNPTHYLYGTIYQLELKERSTGWWVWEDRGGIAITILALEYLLKNKYCKVISDDDIERYEKLRVYL